jgi:DNA-binding NtrC family response regulator
MSEEVLRVLLVDDEASLRTPLASYLRDTYGYQVDTAANGEEALHLVEEVQGQYDVALIDELLIPGPDGLEVMKQIKARHPDVEVILFTGWGLDSALEALRAGAYRYLAKPFNLDELGMTIRMQRSRANCGGSGTYSRPRSRLAEPCSASWMSERRWR